jgi:hypothetical protein
VLWLAHPVSPAERIIGYWQRTLVDGTNVLMQFSPDGTVTFTAMGQKAHGAYRFVAPDAAEIELTGPAMVGSTVGKVHVEFPRKGLLVLRHEGGASDEWSVAE